MSRTFHLAALLLSLAGLGCSTGLGQAHPPDVPGARPDPNKPAPRDPVAEAQFQSALSDMARLDKQGTWNAEACERVAKGFLAAAELPGDTFDAQAVFNAGVARERCGQDAAAKELFKLALSKKGDFHPAKVHLALLRHKETGGKEIDAVLRDLRQAAIVDARYTNVEGLVALAMLSLERGNDVADTDGANDRARAVRYLQSALAVDDDYSPAMNGLALYYLGEARSASGRKAAKKSLASGVAARSGSAQAMELAALVCSQAIRKDPNDAVIHNTYGLIQVELGNLGKAAEAFGKARSLRPGFYEAEMNFAAVNLQFRGFAKAEEAYRAVLRERPEDYDARVGLALALRGQIRPESPEELTEKAAKELEKARTIAPDRPEAYYNEAILTQEYKARGAGTDTMKHLQKARELFGVFMQKAGSAPEYAETVKAAGERIKEIKEMEVFLAGAQPQQGGS
jgi:tetratricopeptide (TPR) repeat protein